MYICLSWRVTFSIAIQYIFICNYHATIMYARVYMILFTKTLDSILYHFIVTNQSTCSLLIIMCNTMDIFFSKPEV